MTKQRLTERRVEKAELLEEDSTTGRVKFRAIVSEGDYINQNGRMYPFDILWGAFQQVNERLARYPGLVDHPDPWEGSKTADIGIHWEGFEPDPGGKLIIGTGHTIGTDSGKNLAAVIEDGIEIGFSTRTSATGEENAHRRTNRLCDYGDGAALC